MARRNQEGVAFGSDSFLDIVANVVGILIILIVIAGVRVSQLPVPTTPVANTEEQVPEQITVASDPLPEFFLPEVVEPEVAEPMPVLEPILAPIQETVDSSRATELLAEIDQLEGEILSLTGRLAAIDSETLSDIEHTTSRRQKIAAARLFLEQLQHAASEKQHLVTRQQAELQSEQLALANLQLQLAEAETDKPHQKELKHYLNPIGKVVEGEEIHFLLSGGRIARVPMKQLLIATDLDMSRHVRQLLQGRTITGEVGPIDGFRSRYIVSILEPSGAAFRPPNSHAGDIPVSDHCFLPEPELVTESIEEALRPDSKFLNHLRRTSLDAALTFWVHPDSFRLQQTLKDFAYDNGFRVAVRPLGEGMPIWASTRGNKSVAQ